ncbi:hypothetical protein QC762_108815 [Podospora pseudocomata]|uniref:Uncharacterized protein n=1 Tax=Podospora pseudocomata TaxID=2093779 RepID=A0ABR0GU47_9PEZI|nr:hypothetical protein QC762_108815 [Podospora pseudocomata]
MSFACPNIISLHSDFYGVGMSSASSGQSNTPLDLPVYSILLNINNINNATNKPNPPTVWFFWYCCPHQHGPYRRETMKTLCTQCEH